MEFSFKERYWHKLTDEERQEVYDSNPNIFDFMNEFKQPDWCNYPEALTPLFGCSSLNKKDTKVCKETCQGCDEYKT